MGKQLPFPESLIFLMEDLKNPIIIIRDFFMSLVGGVDVCK